MAVPSSTAAIVNYRTPAPLVQPPPVFSAASRLRSACSDSEPTVLGIALFHPGRRVIQRLVFLGGDVAAELPLGLGQCRGSCAFNPVLAWCIGNVVGQEDRQGNLFPAKVRESRIDAAVALMMAVGRAQASKADPQPDISAFLTDPLFA
jgi:hypothetical protein